MDATSAAVRRFVDELLTNGVMISDVLSSLLEGFEGKDPWSAEDPPEVLLEMTAGSVAIALRGVSRAEIERATDLITRAGERFIDDLRLAAELAGRRAAMNGERG